MKTGISIGSKPHPLQRPNIVQLPASMLTAKGPAISTSPRPHSLHSGQPAPPPRILNATYPTGAPGYAMMPGAQPYHSGPSPSLAQVQQPQKMELHDAFAYLDRVKAEFVDQPDVYNRFLQIMREFKANAYCLCYFLYYFS
jgi:paired amphipathic helix protein Sin3a